MAESKTPAEKLDERQAEVDALRAEIAEAEAARARTVEEQETAVRMARLDAEYARLQLQLRAAKATTEAQGQATGSSMATAEANMKAALDAQKAMDEADKAGVDAASLDPQAGVVATAPSTDDAGTDEKDNKSSRRSR